MAAALPVRGDGPPAQELVLRFDGAQVAGTPAFELGPSLTLEAWVYLEAYAPFATVMARGVSDPAGGDPFVIAALNFDETGRHVSFTQSTGTPGSLRAAASGGTFPLRRWTHVAGVLDGDDLRLYVDGELAGWGGSAGPPRGGAPLFTVGGRVVGDPPGVFGGLHGALREVRVWSRALSGAQVRAGAGRAATGNEPGLEAAWPLDDGSGAIARDLGPFHRDLRLGAGDGRNAPRWVRAELLETGPHFELRFVQTLTAPALPIPIDFDSDGDLDVVIFSSSQGAPGSITALRNDGRGNFGNVTDEVLVGQGLAPAPGGFAVADFTGDGRDDLLIGDLGAAVPRRPERPRLFVQTSDGRLADETASRLPEGRGATERICAGDLDGDGDVDAYLGNTYARGARGPRVLVNDGAGRFRAPEALLPRSLTRFRLVFTACALLDADGDADLDLALGYGGARDLERDALLVNNGRGKLRFAPERAIPPRAGGADWRTVDLAAADFDGDGRDDLLAAVTNEAYDAPGLQLLLSNGDGTFRDASEGLAWPSRDAAPAGFARRVLPADFNGDGRVDVAIETAGFGPVVLLNAGAARFVDAAEALPSEEPLAQGYVSLAAGDFDGDRRDDLFLAAYGGAWLLRSVRPLPPELLE